MPAQTNLATCAWEVLRSVRAAGFRRKRVRNSSRSQALGILLMRLVATPRSAMPSQIPGAKPMRASAERNRLPFQSREPGHKWVAYHTHGTQLRPEITHLEDKRSAPQPTAKMPGIPAVRGVVVAKQDRRLSAERTAGFGGCEEKQEPPTSQRGWSRGGRTRLPRSHPPNPLRMPWVKGRSNGVMSAEHGGDKPFEPG